VPKKTWVRKEKIIDVGKCKYCNQSMTSEDSFIPIGRLVRNKYQYQNVHLIALKRMMLNLRLILIGKAAIFQTAFILII